MFKPQKTTEKERQPHSLDSDFKKFTTLDLALGDVRKAEIRPVDNRIGKTKILFPRTIGKLATHVQEGLAIRA